VKANQVTYPIATMCRTLGVSPSGYHAWTNRPPSKRTVEDAALSERIKTFHARSRGTYGAPRIHMDLSEEGIRVGRKRIARLMRLAGLCGVSRRKGCRTTIRNGDPCPAPDLVERNFTATAPDRLWVADITYIPAWAGFLYLAVVLDAFSRRIVGWATETHLRTELVLDALNMALWRRRPFSVIHHSDQGCQYTSIAFGKRCKEAGVRPSMGSAGDCYDNALCESFFATLECELLDRRRFKTQAEARMAVFEFLEGWYNRIAVTPERGISPPWSMKDNMRPTLETQAVNSPRNRGNSTGEQVEPVGRRLFVHRISRNEALIP
jgi:putative transposase